MAPTVSQSLSTDGVIGPGVVVAHELSPVKRHDCIARCDTVEIREVMVQSCFVLISAWRNMLEIYRKGSESSGDWVHIVKRPSKKNEPWSLVFGAHHYGVPYKGPCVALVHKRCKVTKNSERDYKVEFDFHEIAALLDLLAESGLDQYGCALSKALSGSVRSLNRLMAAASGLPLPSLERED